MQELFSLLADLSADFFSIKFKDDIWPLLVLILQHLSVTEMNKMLIKNKNDPNYMNKNPKMSMNKNKKTDSIKKTDILLPKNMNKLEITEKVGKPSVGLRYSSETKLKISLLIFIRKMCEQQVNEKIHAYIYIYIYIYMLVFIFMYTYMITCI
jgi:hypothetical protein